MQFSGDIYTKNAISALRRIEF